jgi:hypothetical protein
MAVSAVDEAATTVTPATLTAAGAGAPPVVALLRPVDPRRVAAYDVLGRLGEGGMGTVYLARAADGRFVAIKVIRPEYARDPSFLARFRDEVDAARRVARFCTAQVLDTGSDGDMAYLVTEHVDGPTLAAEIQARGPMRGSTLDGLAIGVAAALHEIHSAGVVHRDLKPSNVLLSRVGPKVIDFGIARAWDATGGHTGSGQIIGTPRYMAPEQIEGRSATAASDVFAWGAVVAYAGTGRPPFGEGPPYALLRRIVERQPDLDGFDEPLRRLVERAMRKRPQDRPSAHALLLHLVGPADDAMTATSRALALAWTPRRSPPLARASGRQSRGATRRATASVLVAALALALLGGAQPPEDTRANAPGRSTVESEPRTIEVGERVPPHGSGVVPAGSAHRFRFSVAPGAELYLAAVGDSCDYLLPWTLTQASGRWIAGGPLCDVYGPMDLGRGGTFELRVGGGNADGRYAFMLTAR